VYRMQKAILTGRFLFVPHSNCASDLPLPTPQSPDNRPRRSRTHTRNLSRTPRRLCAQHSAIFYVPLLHFACFRVSRTPIVSVR
jgi:hypothetical protein